MDPNKNQHEIDDVTQALKQQAQTPAPSQGESKWERMSATLAGAADRSTGWVAARVKDTFQDFVGRVLYGETTSPEPSDKWQEPGKDRNQAEPDKGLDR